MKRIYKAPLIPKFQFFNTICFSLMHVKPVCRLKNVGEGRQLCSMQSFMSCIGRSLAVFNRGLPRLPWTSVSNWLTRKEWRKSSGFCGSSYPSMFHCPELCLMPNLTAREVVKCRSTVPRMKKKLIFSTAIHYLSQPISSWVT